MGSPLRSSRNAMDVADLFPDSPGRKNTSPSRGAYSFTIPARSPPSHLSPPRGVYQGDYNTKRNLGVPRQLNGDSPSNFNSVNYGTLSTSSKYLTEKLQMDNMQAMQQRQVELKLRQDLERSKRDFNDQTNSLQLKIQKELQDNVEMLEVCMYLSTNFDILLS